MARPAPDAGLDVGGWMIAAALLLAIVVYTAERWGPKLLAIWDRYLVMAESDRKVKREAVQVEVEQKQKALHAESRALEPIPADLEALIAEESAQFARDELRAEMRSHYAESGDWQKVRRAVGIGEMP